MDLLIEDQNLTWLDENVLCNCVSKLQKVQITKTKLLESQKSSLRMEICDDYLKIQRQNSI